MPFYFVAINIIAGCWITFCIVWLAAAGLTKRAVYRESRTQRLRYWVLLVVGYLLLMNGDRLPFPLNLRVIPKTDSIEWAGIILCIAGVAVAFWARFTLGRNWSGNITFKEGHELIQGGPYRWARHPIYTGLMTMLFATVIVKGRIAGLLSLALVFASFWIKLRDEEKLMLEQFPDQYPAYQRRVKRIIPFVL